MRVIEKNKSNFVTVYISRLFLIEIIVKLSRKRSQRTSVAHRREQANQCHHRETTIDLNICEKLDRVHSRSRINENRLSDSAADLYPLYYLNWLLYLSHNLSHIDTGSSLRVVTYEKHHPRARLFADSELF